MKVLALDIATRTGWCVRVARGESQHYVRCGFWECKGEEKDRDGFDHRSANLGAALDKLLMVENGIGYAAIESPMQIIPKGRGKDLFGIRNKPQSTPKTIGLLHGMAGSAASSLQRAGIPWRMVTPPEWRMAFIGFAKAPASIAPGDPSTAYLKRAVLTEGQRLGKVYGFTVPNHDAGDAVGIAWWLAGMVQRFRAEDALRGLQAA